MRKVIINRDVFTGHYSSYFHASSHVLEIRKRFGCISGIHTHLPGRRNGCQGIHLIMQTLQAPAYMAYHFT